MGRGFGLTNGFSLVEILLVIALIVVLVAMAVPQYTAALDEARVARAIGDIKASRRNSGSTAWSTVSSRRRWPTSIARRCTTRGATPTTTWCSRGWPSPGTRRSWAPRDRTSRSAPLGRAADRGQRRWELGGGGNGGGNSGGNDGGNSGGSGGGNSGDDSGGGPGDKPRKDRNLHPLNSDFDLYSAGRRRRDGAAHHREGEPGRHHPGQRRRLRRARIEVLSVDFDGSSVRTRVARRLVGLFLLSAVVPTSALAVISYYSVTSYLEAQARQRLHTDSKHLGLGLLMRLQQADDILAWHVGAAQAGPEWQAGRRRRQADGLGQILQVDTTAWAEGRGTPAGWPAARAEQLARLAQGEALLLTVGTDAGRDIWIVRGFERSQRGIALALRVPPDVVGGALDEWLPEGSRAEVRDAGGEVVARAAKGLEGTRRAQERRLDRRGPRVAERRIHAADALRVRGRDVDDHDRPAP